VGWSDAVRIFVLKKLSFFIGSLFGGFCRHRGFISGFLGNFWTVLARVSKVIFWFPYSDSLCNVSNEVFCKLLFPQCIVWCLLFVNHYVWSCCLCLSISTILWCEFLCGKTEVTCYALSRMWSFTIPDIYPVCDRRQVAFIVSLVTVIYKVSSGTLSRYSHTW